MDSNDFLINRYLPRTDFESYDDFKKNYSVNVPFDFNFAYDIIDEWAKNFPDKKALYYTNDHGVLKEYTFKDISLLSNKTANALRAEGIKKGDTVLMMLKQRAEVWITIIALHKLGAVVIPATLGAVKAVEPTPDVCLSIILLISSNFVFNALFSRAIFNRSSSLLAAFKRSSFSFIIVS